MREIIEDSVESHNEEYTLKQKFFMDQPYYKRQGARLEYDYSRNLTNPAREDTAPCQQHGQKYIGAFFLFVESI